MNAAYALLKIHRVPRQIIIEEDPCKLEVDSLSACRRAQENLWSVLTLKAPLCRNLRPTVTTLQSLDSLSGKPGLDRGTQAVDAPEVGREDNHFFFWIHVPELLQSAQQNTGLGLHALGEVLEQYLNSASLLWEGERNHRGDSFLA